METVATFCLYTHTGLASFIKLCCLLKVYITDLTKYTIYVQIETLAKSYTHLITCLLYDSNLITEGVDLLKLF